MMKNCTNCMRFITCKFVEKNKEFAKQMYPMFEYLERNNLNELFYSNAPNCKFFVDNEMKVDDLLKKIETAKYQIGWIHEYVKSLTAKQDPEFVVGQLIKTTENYKKELDK